MSARASDSKRSGAGKKRKHAPTTSSLGKEKQKTSSSQSASRMMLDDIFSTVPKASKGKEREDADVGKKKKTVKASVGAGGGKVSAVDLLMGGTSFSTPASSSVEETKRKKAKALEPKPSKPTNTDSQRGLEAAKKENPKLSPPSTPTTTIMLAASTSTHVDLEFDIAAQLKILKHTLRTLLSTFTFLSSELTLVDRMWYKNASQFHSALWWSRFNALRRSNRTLLPLAKEVVRAGCLIYAGLGGGMDAFRQQEQAEGEWGSVAKFERRSTADMAGEFLSHPDATELIRTTIDGGRTLEVALLGVKERAEAAGSTLSVHLNTPPAPTFAPLVTAFIALSASVHALVTDLLDGKPSSEEEKQDRLRDGPVTELVASLEVLQQAQQKVSGPHN